MKLPIWLSWSSGKDSAWALHTLRQDPAIDVRALLTTVNETHDRVAMHAVRRDLLRAQARALGVALEMVDIPYPCANEQYEAAMTAAIDRARAQGIREVAFGDLYLEDIRAWREERMAPTGLGTRFPIWGIPTDELARQMLAAGLRAVITCVDPRKVPAEWAGREWNAELLAELPAGVDPCGENGEFHTFVFDGPGFGAPLPVQVGEVVERDGFVFADVVLSA
ncbi:MAG: ATP-binding protein [Planctomycetota bacterium]